MKNNAERLRERTMAEEMVMTEETTVETEGKTPDVTTQTKTVEELQAELEKEKARYSKLKGTLDNKLHELGEVTKRERARMSEEEIKAKEIEEIKAQNAELLRERQIVAHEKQFMKLGCGDDLASEGAMALANGDYDALFDVFKKVLDNSISTEKSALLKSMPKPQNSSSSDTITTEQFAKMGYRERVELMNSNPELYRKLTS